MGNINDYLSAMSKGKTITHDPFSHAQSLLKDGEEIQFEKEYYTRLVRWRSILGNIGDDYLMLLNHNDVDILTAAYELAFREIEFRPVFKYMFNSWEGRLMLTRAFRGKERDLQSTPGGGYAPPSAYEGYGRELGYGPEEEQPNQGILDKARGIVSLRPKLRQPNYNTR